MAITDDFNRASLGSGWVSAGGTIWTLPTSTYAKAVDDSSYSAIIRSESAFPDDQYAQAKMECFNGPSNGQRMSPMIRADDSGTGYLFQVESDTNIFLYKRNPIDGNTIIGSGVVDASITAGVYFTGKISAIGTTIKVFIEGNEEISVTDATIASGKPGLTTHGGGDSSKLSRFDDFECTDAVSSSGQPTSKRMARIAFAGYQPGRGIMGI